MTTLHPIPPGLYCVPSAIVAVTGADVSSVVMPAINRAEGRDDFLTPAAGVYQRHTIQALQLMGYRVSRYKGGDVRARVSTWARRSVERYPGCKLLVFIPEHVVAVCDGRVYDNHAAHGPQGDDHPFANSVAKEVYLVEPKGRS